MAKHIGVSSILDDRFTYDWHHSKHSEVLPSKLHSRFRGLQSVSDPARWSHYEIMIKVAKECPVVALDPIIHEFANIPKEDSLGWALVECGAASSTGKVHSSSTLRYRK